MASLARDGHPRRRLVFAVMVGIALLIWGIAIVLDRMDIRQIWGG
jgi:hypothetical protein